MTYKYEVQKIIAIKFGVVAHLNYLIYKINVMSMAKDKRIEDNNMRPSSGTRTTAVPFGK